MSDEKSRLVPAYINVAVLQPVSGAFRQLSEVRSKRISVSGESREIIYDQLLDLAEGAIKSPAYTSDPKAWWEERGGYPELERGMSKNFKRPFSSQLYTVGEGESPKIAAKIIYGSEK